VLVARGPSARTAGAEAAG